MSAAAEHASQAIPVLFCGCAALVSLCVLMQTRARRDRADDLLGLAGLGVLVILGWGWASAFMANVEYGPVIAFAASLALALIAKVVAEREVNVTEDRIILGGITLLPLGVQMFL